MHNEGFGKRWIDKILGKVDKDQGVANAGKVLGIGADGIVTPVEQSGGGSSITVDSALNLGSTNPVENGAITSALNGKVDKDQGVANAGMVLGIGNDGQVVPVAQSGGGSGPVLEAISNIGFDELKSKVKVGDNLLVNINYRVANTVNASNLTPVVAGELTHFTGDMTPSYVITDKTCFMTIRNIASNISLAQNPIVYHRETTEITINSVKYPLFTNNIVYPNLIGSSGITVYTVGEATLGGNSGVIPRHANIYTYITTDKFNGYIIHNS